MLDRWNQAKPVLLPLLGGLAALFGGWDHPLEVLLTLVLLDWTTALLARSVTGKVNSSVGWKGIGKKVGYFCLVALAHVVDGMIVTGVPAVRTAVVIMLAGNEGISILENLTEMGIPVPAFLRNALEKARKVDGAS